MKRHKIAGGNIAFLSLADFIEHLKVDSAGAGDIQLQAHGWGIS